MAATLMVIGNERLVRVAMSISRQLRPAVEMRVLHAPTVQEATERLESDERIDLIACAPLTAARLMNRPAYREVYSARAGTEHPLHLHCLELESDPAHETGVGEGPLGLIWDGHRVTTEGMALLWRMLLTADRGRDRPFHPQDPLGA